MLVLSSIGAVLESNRDEKKVLRVPDAAMKMERRAEKNAESKRHRC